MQNLSGLALGQASSPRFLPENLSNLRIGTAMPPLRDAHVEDKFTALDGEIYLSGVEALVRLLIVQKARDAAAGLNTAGFASGYRGSPLGGIDRAFAKAAPYLAERDIRFVPGVNEELAATAVWGSQQTGLIGDTRHDGVFSLWYGKGPGVDRCIDVFKHMNHAGTARNGGVLLVAGDDHGAYSSTLPHQSDHVFAASMIPVLYPCNVHEYLELGLHGWAMSRFSGCAVGFKALADTVESSASVSADPFAVETRLPEGLLFPPAGVNAQNPGIALGAQARLQESLMHDYKIYAALAYARENHLNRITMDSPLPRVGIVASGKSYQDVLEALSELGVDEKMAARIGLRLFKVAMPWPLEPETTREFATGLEEILVVEEKRQVVEYQLKEQLYNWRENVRPRVIGKFDERGEWRVHNEHGRGDWLLSAKGDFTVAQIARVIAGRLQRLELPASVSEHIHERLALLDEKEAVLRQGTGAPARPAFYCSGCPHNTSTRVPDGSVALAGIGCHVMAASIFPESNRLVTQMGGEGAPWIGAAPFSEREHIFANLGDGTYFHSGLLSIRAAVAANRQYPVNITYKILFNDAVAMTGGQPIDGQLTPAGIAQQVRAEGVERIALVSDQPQRYELATGLPSDVSVHHRDDLDEVQRELREVAGVSVLIYDQTCAAENRRRQKRGLVPQPPREVVINDAVCEGCGDCGLASNCVAITPKPTAFGVKRAIDSSACNKDYSCLKGLCPSFVTVENATRRNVAGELAAGRDLSWIETLELPAPADAADGYNVLITGVGGTGVLTVGALLGMAAHLEGKAVSVLDMTGMSQKNGAVLSHVRFAEGPDTIKAQRIAIGEADLLLGCDFLTAGNAEALSKTRLGRTHAVINTFEQATGEFASQPDWVFPAGELKVQIDQAVGKEGLFVNATRLAKALLGDSIATNLFMLGFAFQHGLLPVSRRAIRRAIELNGVSIENNHQAFEWGRLAAASPDRVEAEAFPRPAKGVVVEMPASPKQAYEDRYAFLVKYQNEAYAKRFAKVIERVREVERKRKLPGRLRKAVTENLFALMAYKDEYEVARLHLDPAFKARLDEEFEPGYKLRYHLAPPLLSKPGADGRPKKRAYGPWMKWVFGLLVRFKGLRGSVLDVFGYAGDRKLERDLLDEYLLLVDSLLARVNADNYNTAVALAELPAKVRGYGEVKRKRAEAMREARAELLSRLDEQTAKESEKLPVGLRVGVG